MNNFENHEVISNQILPNLLCVLIFGQLLGPIWPNLVQFGQIFSFQDRNLNFASNVHFLELLTNFMSELENVALFGRKFGPNLAKLGPNLWPNGATFSRFDLKFFHSFEKCPSSANFKPLS